MRATRRTGKAVAHALHVLGSTLSLKSAPNMGRISIGRIFESISNMGRIFWKSGEDFDGEDF